MESYQEKIESFIYDYPVCEFYYLTPEELTFTERVRYICTNGCEHYGRSWACPPAVPAVEECIARCRQYRHVFLFSSVADVPDCMDFAACLAARREHEKMTAAIRDRFRALFGPVLALSTGCMVCDTCTYPDAPCRAPEQRISPLESYGILLSATAETLGAAYDCGNNMVSYFSLIFFNTPEEGAAR